MGAAISMFEDCFKGKRPVFGNKRRAVVNLHDMGVDIYEPAGMRATTHAGCAWSALNRCTHCVTVVAARFGNMNVTHQMRRGPRGML